MADATNGNFEFKPPPNVKEVWLQWSPVDPRLTDTSEELKDKVWPLKVKDDQSYVFVQTSDHFPMALPWNGTPWAFIGAGGAALLGLLIVAYGVVVLWQIVRNRIDISWLVSEADGKASLSRFQALIFTFVFAIGIALLVAKNGEMPKIPGEALALLAGSLGTYLAAKLIQGQSAPDLTLLGQEGLSIRYGTDASQALAAAGTALTGNTIVSNEVKAFSVVAGSNTVESRLMPVALLVGSGTVTLTAQGPAGIDFTGEVRKTRLGQPFTTEPFDASKQHKIVSTAADVMLVEVEFQSATPRTVVTVRVA